LAETAIDTLGHVNIVARGSASTVSPPFKSFLSSTMKVPRRTAPESSVRVFDGSRRRIIHSLYVVADDQFPRLAFKVSRGEARHGASVLGKRLP
jgi:hypothetical protein